jgi:hypothetical protein
VRRGVAGARRHGTFCSTSAAGPATAPPDRRRASAIHGGRPTGHPRRCASRTSGCAARVGHRAAAAGSGLHGIRPCRRSAGRQPSLSPGRREWQGWRRRKLASWATSASRRRRAVRSRARRKRPSAPPPREGAAPECGRRTSSAEARRQEAGGAARRCACRPMQQAKNGQVSHKPDRSGAPTSHYTGRAAASAITHGATAHGRAHGHGSARPKGAAAGTPSACRRTKRRVCLCVRARAPGLCSRAP